MASLTPVLQLVYHLPPHLHDSILISIRPAVHMYLSWSPFMCTLTCHGGRLHGMHPRELPSEVQTIEQGPQLILFPALLRVEHPLSHIFSAQQRLPLTDGWVFTLEERSLHFLAGQPRRELVLIDLSPLSPLLLYEPQLMLDQRVHRKGFRLGDSYWLALLLFLFLMLNPCGAWPLWLRNYVLLRLG